MRLYRSSSRRVDHKVKRLALLAALLFAIDRGAPQYIAAQAQDKSASSPKQTNTVNGTGNNAGNVNQNGSGNTAVIGNGNSVGKRTYNIAPKTAGWLLPASDPMPSMIPPCDAKFRSDPSKPVALYF